jgi:hypothetical protein
MRLTRRATRNQLTKRNNEHLPAGIGVTITGGPMEPIGLMEILERGARGASRSGAVSGAAQVVASSFGGTGRVDCDIALSDGSRISFASIADAGVLRDDNEPMAWGAQTPLPQDSKVPVPSDGKLRARRDDKARASATNLARVLASV